MALSSEFVALVQQEIPEGRQSLQDSHANLEKVAAYCIENFARAENKVAALEETKNYTTQSLASVAYQINTLAYNFLQMIEQQTNQLGEMESQVNYISQMVMIHKEKVARREIGVLTSNKATTRQYKILAPANGEKPIKYVRKPIDFTRLDDIGHGLRSSNSSRSRRSASSVGSTGAQVSPHAQPTATAGPAPTTKPPTPPQANRSVSSLSRGSREYRTPPAVAPPQVPSNYAPNYPMGHPRRNEKGSGYSTLPHPSTAHSNTHNSGMGISAHQNSGMGISAHQNFQVGLTQPMQHPQQAVMQMPHGMMQAYLPPPQQDSVQYSSNIMGIPRGYLYDYTPQHQYRILTTPPGIVSDREFFNRSSGAASPPLPPPPPEEPQEQNYIPPVYEEKVIAVYDYAADKEDELTFSENAVIYVLKKNDDGWWEGVLNGVTGLFPGNYVEPLM